MEKQVTKTVAEMVKELKENPSKRFSKSDYQALVFGVLSDKEFKSKKFLLRNGKLQEEDASINSDMLKFLDKLLKHAGMNNYDERQAVLESFSYNPKDVEWVADAVDEAMYQYAECDKNMRMFRDKMLQLTVKKMVRSGKASGSITYKKSVSDRSKMLKTE